MTYRATSFLLLCSLAVIGVACDGTSSVTGPRVSALSGTPRSTSLLVAGTPGRASGHAFIHGTPVQGVKDEVYSFSAVSAGTFPAATGELELHVVTFANLRVNVHASITCLSVVGNLAWVAGRVTREMFDGEEVPAMVGKVVVFRVQDMGEGHQTNDRATLAIFGVTDDMTYCQNMPTMPRLLRESVNGNIQVSAQ